MKTLKAKFEKGLDGEKDHFAAQKKAYKTKLCDGLGCEPDAAKREQNLAEWKLIEAGHEAETKRIQHLLDDIEEMIADPPFRSCPEFEEYLRNKKQMAHGKKL